MGDLAYSYSKCSGIIVDQISGTLRPNFQRRGKGLFIGPTNFYCYFKEFNIEILNMPDDGAISIGVCPDDYAEDAHIGWQSQSIGYHADDGGIFMEMGSSIENKAPYRAGDIVGCNFNTDTSTVKFTKNKEVVYETIVDFEFSNLYPGIVIGSEDTYVNLLEREPWKISWQSIWYECKTCESRDVSKKCIECGDYLCQECVDRHKRGKKTKFHTILDKDKQDEEDEMLKQIFCAMHGYEPFVRYSSTRSKLICAECLRSEPKDNEIARIDDIAQIRREKFEEVSKSAKEKARPVRRVVDSMSTLIKRRAQFLRETITKAENELLNLTTAVVGDMDKAIEEAESILESHTDTRIVARDAHMTSLIEEIEKSRVPIKLSQNEVDEKLLAKTSDISEPKQEETN